MQRRVGKGGSADGDNTGKPDEARSSSDASSGSHFSAPRCLDGGGVRSGGGSNGDGDGSSLGLGSPADWSATEEAFMSFSEAAAGGAPTSGTAGEAATKQRPSVVATAAAAPDVARGLLTDEPDEALRRWRDAVATAAAPGGSGERFTACEPLVNSRLDEALAVSTMLLFFGWVLISPPLGCWLIYRAVVRGSRAAAATLALWLGTCLLPGGRRWQPMVDWHVWDTWRRYFRLRWVTPPRPLLDPGTRYLFLHFPHAVFPMGSFLSMGLTGNEEVTGIPQYVPGAIASVLLQAPLVRHVFLMAGCIPADRESINAGLQRRSLGFLPEGIAGIFNGANRQREQIFFSGRKGIIAIAIRAGVEIVPTYFLGQSQMFEFWGSRTLSRRLRVSLGVFWGRWGLPLPRKTDIIALVGAPIPVVQKDNPTHAEVDELHGRVAEAVRQLYERHRQLLPGHADRHLTVV